MCDYACPKSLFEKITYFKKIGTDQSGHTIIASIFLHDPVLLNRPKQHEASKPQSLALIFEESWFWLFFSISFGLFFTEHEKLSYCQIQSILSICYMLSTT